jgi:hypothetical protein
MLSQREAGSKWHVSRATIQRAIKRGKLSLTPHKTIDPAEMLRVFGEPEPAPSRPNEPLEPPPSHPDSSAADARIAAFFGACHSQA